MRRINPLTQIPPNANVLDDAQKSVLSSLAFFERSATLESLIAISLLDRNALRSALETLTAVSLVGEELGAEDRYHLNQLTRGYVQRKVLGDDLARRNFGTRFFRYWLEYSRRYAVGRDSYQTFQHLDTEWPNIKAAHHWLWSACFQDGKVTAPDLAGLLNEFAEVLGAYLVCRGKWDERLSLSDHAYATEALLYNWDGAFWRSYDVAWILIQRGEISEAEKWIVRCKHAASRTTNSDKHKAIADRLIGLVQWANGHLAMAARLLHSALEVMNRLALDNEMARLANDLVVLHGQCGEGAQARYYLETVRTLITKPIGREEQCRGYLSEATVALLDGDPQRASDWYDKTGEIALELGRSDLHGKALMGLAAIEEKRGNTRTSLEFAKSALTHLSALRHRYAESAQDHVFRLMNGQLP